MKRLSSPTTKLVGLLPILVGSNANEMGLGTLFVSNKNAILSSGNTIFDCLTADAAKVRLDNKVNAWRYRYAGDWPNQKLTSSSGAYHGSELPMLFGTSEYLSLYYGELFKQNISFADTEEQKKLAKTMMTAWTSFAKDPENGLSKLGWPVYDPKNPTVVQLGGDGSSAVTFALAKTFDSRCGLVNGLIGILGLGGQKSSWGSLLGGIGKSFNPSQ